MKKLVFILLFPLIAYSENNIKIIDGDTIHLNGYKIRFSGIDAPEINQNCKKNNKVIECGLIAKDLILSKIAGFEPVCILEGKDRYGRFLGECFINDKSLSKYLVRQGFAFAYTKYSKKFVLDENYAIKNKLGMWDMDFIFPWDYRKNNYNFK
ncbi:MAG: nuclease [Pelagibacteraceae bacterium]|nr:nuclease [Pelagibacteraceae bacterium]|tara:strand:+ start:565 stop:1023 length:459 start_codon:yes stop_codon:yes gene_type:complete